MESAVNGVLRTVEGNGSVDEASRSASAFAGPDGSAKRSWCAASALARRLTDWRASARFKLAIVLEGGYARVVAGTADNPKMAAFGQVVLDQARAAAELAAVSPLPSTS